MGENGTVIAGPSTISSSDTGTITELISRTLDPNSVRTSPSCPASTARLILGSMAVITETPMTP